MFVFFLRNRRTNKDNSGVPLFVQLIDVEGKWGVKRGSATNFWMQEFSTSFRSKFFQGDLHDCSRVH